MFVERLEDLDYGHAFCVLLALLALGRVLYTTFAGGEIIRFVSNQIDSIRQYIAYILFYRIA